MGPILEAVGSDETWIGLISPRAQSGETCTAPLPGGVTMAQVKGKGSSSGSETGSA